MYHYVKDKNYIKQVTSVCSDLLNQLKQNINKEGHLNVHVNLIGSGARNMVTQNASEPIDLDYNIVIDEFYGIDPHKDAKLIKEYIMPKFNEVLEYNELPTCNDSTSAITTKLMRLCNRQNDTEFSIDIGIIVENDEGWYRLIHHKNNFPNDCYVWEEATNTDNMLDKVKTIKRENLWNEVRTVYLDN